PLIERGLAGDQAVDGSERVQVGELGGGLIEALRLTRRTRNPHRTRPSVTADRELIHGPRMKRGGVGGTESSAVRRRRASLRSIRARQRYLGAGAPDASVRRVPNRAARGIRVHAAEPWRPAARRHATLGDSYSHSGGRLGDAARVARPAAPRTRPGGDL